MTAWMIKNDGTEIPVVTHVYADKEETDELLALAYFLWQNDVGSHQTVRRFLDAWAFHALSKRLKSRIFVQDEVIDAIKQYLAAKPYHIFPEEFAEEVANNAALLKRRGKGERVDAEPSDGSNLIDTLNQRFLRVRYGGKKNTVPGCRDMYFRISSVGFDWFPIIRGFVEKYPDPIETVTIIRDFESTESEKYYKDFQNRPYNKMPLTDFLNGTGTTRFTTISQGHSVSGRVTAALANGGSVQQLRSLPANYERIRNTIQRLKCEEEANLACE